MPASRPEADREGADLYSFVMDRLGMVPCTRKVALRRREAPNSAMVTAARPTTAASNGRGLAPSASPHRLLAVRGARWRK